MTPEERQAFKQMQNDINEMKAELASLRELTKIDPELEATLDGYLAEKEQQQ